MHMQGNIMSCVLVILPLQVVLPSDVTSVSEFHVHVSGFPIILPSQVILPFGDIIAASAVAVVRIWYNKAIVEVVGLDKGVVYLTSPGHPTDIGLQLGKACYTCNR